MAPTDLQQLLHSTFGFPAFRASQQAVCEAAVAGRDVLLVMPTGAGKSLCYQLPALARGGTALVISPLIALMDDQANKLTSLGLRVGRIHSGLDREHSRQVCRDYLDGALQFLFIAPERFRVPGFGAMLAKRPLALIAIDEAHCISQWGHDFRPDYRNLASHLKALRPAPVIALTATATPQVQRDIVSELALDQPAQFIQGFRRTNLAIEVVEVSKPRRTELARKLLRDAANRPAIIYAPSRKDAEALASELNAGFSTATYHAGLDPGTRDRVQRAFLGGDTQVVVATIAFGMGIDKADVRTVIHMAMPASVESFYQEIGRAGRDGKPARTVLMYSFADRRMHDFFLERDYPPTDTLARIATALRDEPIHADDLRITLKLDLDVFGPALDKLLAQGAAHIDMGNNVTRASDGTGAWRRNYDTQVNFRRGQIDAMMRFASGAECRMAALIRHFGDASDASKTCGLCDFCSPERASAQTFREPTRDESGEIKRLLRALAASPSGKSTGKLYTELFPKAELDRKEMDALLDALTRAGYTAIESASFVAEDGREIAYRRASLTHEGREAADGEPLAGMQMRDAEAVNAGRTRSKSGSPSKAKQEADNTPLTTEQKTLDAALRAWRAAEAKSLGKPAFVVFGDRTLRQIALDAPATAADLQGISGIGPAKAERWGEAILAVVNGTTPPQSMVPAIASPPRERTAKPAPLQSKPTVQTTISYLQPRGADGNSAPISLEHALKIWRMHEAKRLSTTPFDLLHDRTIREIVAIKPLSVDDLRGVTGVASDFADQYGEAVCTVVARNA